MTAADDTEPTCTLRPIAATATSDAQADVATVIEHRPAPAAPPFRRGQVRCFASQPGTGRQALAAGRP